MKTIHILHLEDNLEDVNLIKTLLNHLDLTCEILWVNTKEKFEAVILNPELDIVLSDYTLPDYDGLTALKYTKKIRPDIPYIVLSGTVGEEKTIELFEAGATDFITKDKLQRLEPAIHRAIHESEEINKRKKAEQKLKARELLFSQFTENIPEVFWQRTPNLDKIIYVSPAFEKIWGKTLEELARNPNAWVESILAEDQHRVHEVFSTMESHDRQSVHVEYRIIRPDGQIRTIQDHGILLKENDKTVGVIGVASDITDIKINERYLTVQNQLSRTLVETENLQEGMAKFLKIVCVNFNWSTGEVWLIDDTKTKLNFFAIWPQDQAAFQTFRNTSTEIEFKMNVGLSGRVWASKKNHWISNLSLDPNFPRAEAASQSGLKSGFGIPIIFKDQVIGIIEFFSAETREEEPEMTKIFDTISNQVGTSLMQRLTSEKLRISLTEKESMLKEIYHRVKNNLQVVSSLLYMQAKSIPDKSSRELFLESSARVKSMALVHEMLYQSGNLSHIEMQKYLQNLTSYLVEIYHINTSLIKLIIQSEAVSLGIEEAIPCGLIVNELISNVYKHAFPKGKSGEIKVLIEKNEKNVTVQVSDNGIGFSSQIDFQNTTTLGIQLVHALTKQLGGEIKLDNTHGTTITLIFPVVLRGQKDDNKF